MFLVNIKQNQLYLKPNLSHIFYYIVSKHKHGTFFQRASSSHNIYYLYSEQIQYRTLFLYQTVLKLHYKPDTLDICYKCRSQDMWEEFGLEPEKEHF